MPTRDEAMEQFERLARTSPEDAAKRIVKGVKRNERRVLIGMDAQLIDGMQRLFPTAYQRLLITLGRWRGEPAD